MALAARARAAWLQRSPWVLSKHGHQGIPPPRRETREDSRRRRRLLDSVDQSGCRGFGDRRDRRNRPRPAHRDRNSRGAGDRSRGLVDGTSGRPGPDGSGQPDRGHLRRRAAARPRLPGLHGQAAATRDALERHPFGLGRCRSARRPGWPHGVGGPHRRGAGRVLHGVEVGLGAPPRARHRRSDGGHKASPRLPHRAAFGRGRYRSRRRVGHVLVVHRD